MDYKKIYESKEKTFEEAAKLIESEDKIWAGWFNSAPYSLIDAICQRVDELKNVDIITAILAKANKAMTDPSYIGKINFHTIFAGGLERKNFDKGTINYNSVNFSESNNALKENYKVNTLIVTACEMDEDGYFNLGPQGASWAGPVSEYAEKIIVSVNKNMPKNEKGTTNKIHIDKVDVICREDFELFELNQPAPRESDEKIASYILEQLPDEGATIQVGLGGIANAVAYGLDKKKNYACQTEMITDSIVHLGKLGVLNKGVKAAFAFGNKENYEWSAKNAELVSISEANSIFDLENTEKFISINSCLMVDFTGQVCSESLGHTQFSSTGGQLDFVDIAYKSKGGMSFLCLNAARKNKDGSLESNIKLNLPQGQIVTTPRSKVDFIVTEYGLYRLKNRPIRQRVEGLISIAHPDLRDELRKQAIEAGLIRQ